jgi:hypothetical protein
VQSPLTCGPSGWPAGQTPRPVGPTLLAPMSFLDGDTLQEAVKCNPRPGVGGGRDPWPAGQHLANYSYKYPLRMKFRTPHSACSSSVVSVPVQ